MPRQWPHANATSLRGALARTAICSELNRVVFSRHMVGSLVVLFLSPSLSGDFWALLAQETGGDRADASPLGINSSANYWLVQFVYHRSDCVHLEIHFLCLLRPLGFLYLILTQVMIVMMIVALFLRGYLRRVGRPGQTVRFVF